MERKKINKELWASFLKIYSACGCEGKISKKIMLAAILAVLLINAGTVCYLAIKNQADEAGVMEELMQMLLLLVLSSGIVGYNVVKKSPKEQENEKNNNILSQDENNRKGEK